MIQCVSWRGGGILGSGQRRDEQPWRAHEARQAIKRFPWTTRSARRSAGSLCESRPGCRASGPPSGPFNSVGCLSWCPCSRSPSRDNNSRQIRAPHEVRWLPQQRGELAGGLLAGPTESPLGAHWGATGEIAPPLWFPPPALRCLLGPWHLLHRPGRNFKISLYSGDAK